VKGFKVSTVLVAITLHFLTGCRENPGNTQPLGAQRTGIEVPTAVFTANPNASTRTKCVLNYLYKLTTRADKRVVSGQYFEWPNPDPGYIREAQELVDKTGHWVGLVGGEYVTFDEHKNHANPALRPDRVNPRLIDYWNQGGLVTITCTFRTRRQGIGRNVQTSTCLIS